MGEQIKVVRQVGLTNYSRHYLFVTWRMMNYRCYSPVHGSYETYGGSGIEVCLDWRWDNPHGFCNFLRDKDPRPEGHTLDRIDPYGSYTNENTRWATKLVQQNNFRVHKNSITGINGVIITPEGLYRAQTNYLGKIWSIIVTENKEEAEQAISLVREFKLSEPKAEDFEEFLQGLSKLSPTGKKLHVRKTSKYYGVAWRKDRNKWRASGYNKKGEGKSAIHLGHFVTEEEAYAAVEKFLAEKEK